MQHALKTVFVMLAVGLFVCRIPSAEAFFTPHPLQDYDHGLQYLNAYRGDAKTLDQAQNLFTHIIEKHPDSPLGYLGMSQLKTIEAYRYGQHYNIKIITQEAMPLALKAMRMGPTLNKVHDNYERFEKIFRDNDENQDYVRRLLLLFPDKAGTYFALADYLSDQADFEKALEYYKIALRFSSDKKEKLKAVQRIKQIYLIDLPDKKLAAEYSQAAQLDYPVGENSQDTSLHSLLGNLYYK